MKLLRVKDIYDFVYYRLSILLESCFGAVTRFNIDPFKRKWGDANQLIISSHPNLQIDITCHSGRMGLSGREIDKTGFGLCHSGLWTFLDVFVSRLLQICAGFGLVSDDQIFWRAHQIC